MKILVCGSRDWTDRQFINAALKQHCSAGDILIHGDCRGADLLAESVGLRLGMHVIACKANWRFYKNSAGPIRNGIMASLNPDLVIAFHDNFLESKGTKDMIEKATRACIKCLLFSHNTFGEQGVELGGENGHIPI